MWVDETADSVREVTACLCRLLVCAVAGHPWERLSERSRACRRCRRFQVWSGYAADLRWDDAR